MKKIQIILSVMVLLVSLTGCGNQKVQNNDSQKDNATTNGFTDDNQENANKDTKESTSTNSNKKDNTSTNSSKTEKSTNNDTGSQNIAKESSKDQKSFYGSWKVTKSIPTNGIHATIDESEVIGLTMKFSSDGVTFGNQSFQNPKYAITNLSIADFREQYHREPSELGLSGDTITCVSVNTTGEQPKFSNSFIVKDNNTLIYCVEGVYFEVKRES